MLEHGLTPRELEVARALAHGRTATQIAEAGGYAQGTINSHVKNACRRLGHSCTRRGELMVWLASWWWINVGVPDARRQERAMLLRAAELLRDRDAAVREAA